MPRAGHSLDDKISGIWPKTLTVGRKWVNDIMSFIRELFSYIFCADRFLNKRVNDTKCNPGSIYLSVVRHILWTGFQRVSNIGLWSTRTFTNSYWVNSYFFIGQLVLFCNSYFGQLVLFLWSTRTFLWSTRTFSLVNSYFLKKLLIVTLLNRDYINPANSRPIKCQILATLLYFFAIGRQFLGFGNRPIVGRPLVDNSVDFIFEWAPYHRPMASADSRPTIGR